MENLIAIEGIEKYQYRNLKDLIKKFVDENYFNMSDEEKLLELEKRTIANAKLCNIPIIKLREDRKNYNNKSFILYNEITYILSLVKFNRIVLLEKRDANIFGRYINKINIENNYLIINTFVDEIMKKYLKI